MAVSGQLGRLPANNQWGYYVVGLGSNGITIGETWLQLTALRFPVLIPSIKTCRSIASEAVGDILAAVSQKAGRKAELMSLPNNAFLRAKVTIGGSGMTARAFMTQVVNAISVPMYWELTYDADVDLYLMVITPATRVYHDAFGHRIETDGMAPQP